VNNLSLFKNSGHNILLNADNIFWAIVPTLDKHNVSVPQDVANLYKNFKDKLNREMNNFRFSQELTAVYIDPTDRCNANCPYCYIPATIRQDGKAMSQEGLNFILDKIAHYFKNKKRKALIVFHAAEPLLVKKIIFKAIVEYGRIFKFGLQTNGILLEKEDVGFLKKYRVGVGISLDSSLPSLNNRLRPALGGNSNFNKAVAAIDWFNGYEGLNVITTVTKFNVKDLPRIVKFLHAKRVPCVLMNPVRFTQASIRSFKPNQKTLSQYFIKAVDTAVELSKNTKRKIIIGNFANTILAIIAPPGRRLMCDISPCGAGRCFFTITAKGEMIPCGEFIGLRRFSGGNIFNTAISQAMESRVFKRVRARIVEKISECATCDFRNICGAPCPAELYSLGNMYQKSVFCEFYKNIIKYAFKLIAEEKIRYLLRDGALEHFEYEYDINQKGTIWVR
jgi:uncharacterized protein